MNPPLPLRLVMVPMICGLTLLALDPATAAPSKKAPPAQAPVVEPPPPAKRGFFQKINPFRPKETPPAPAPVAAPLKNSKKSGAEAKPAAPAPAPSRAAVPAQAPAKSLGKAKPLPPTVAAPPAVSETPKKAGFFSRLKSKLDREPESVVAFEKPERPADWQERWVVTEESTAFYEFGPSQASGPDLRLPRGQVVKLASASRGWARVELDGGRRGYLGTDQIRQAAETDFAPPALAANSQLAAAAGGRTPQGWSPIAPPPDLPDLPMAAGMEDSLLLLPPLEFEGTELKRSSLRIPGVTPPDLRPGDPLPSAGPEVPALKLEEVPAPAPDPSPPSEPADPPAPEAPAAEDAKPAPEAPAAAESLPPASGPNPSV
jgi:hypothetical protein